jgi:hypothetical protein
LNKEAQVEKTTPLTSSPVSGGAIPYVMQLEPSFSSAENLEAVFLSRIWSGDHPHTATYRLRGSLEREVLPAGFVIERTYRNPSRRALCARSGDGTAGLLLAGGPGVTFAEMSASSEGALEALMAALDPYLPAKDDEAVEIHYWSDGRHGPDDVERAVAMNPWSIVRANFPTSTSTPLALLMGFERPADTASLILWHGVPGTGKTTAVGALAQSWSSWAETHVVTDPEKFFGQPAYLLQVILRAPERSAAVTTKKWVLVVCEDADEYLRSDARQRSGAALGRLLNVTDGLLGRGLGIVVLLTTNDDVGRLHPAVTRPGRCLGTVEFTTFSPAEAASWLGEGHVTPTRPMTLAELGEIRRMAPHVRSPQRELSTGAYL